MEGVELVLFHPGAAAIDCDDCRKHEYDLTTGKPITYHAGPKREEKIKIRPPGTFAPCEQCPKKSPENAKRIALSLKNWKTLAIYRQVKATCGACLTDAMRNDRLLMKNMASIDVVYQAFERQQQAKAQAAQLSHLMATLLR